MAEKTRYTDSELEEFREIINEKLRLARRDQSAMMKQLMNADGNDVDDTSPTYKALEEGSASQSKEDLVQMANRQQKFIQGLEAALVRIENKNIRYRSYNRRIDPQRAFACSTACNTQRGLKECA